MTGQPQSIKNKRKQSLQSKSLFSGPYVSKRVIALENTNTTMEILQQN